MNCHPFLPAQLIWEKETIKKKGKIVMRNVRIVLCFVQSISPKGKG